MTNKIKEIRLKTGLNRKQLAEKSGIHYKKITDYENNYIRFENVTVGNALKLAKALGVTLDELCDDENETKE